MKHHHRLLSEQSLWIMIAAPSVWAAHFLLCYWVAAVWCAKLGRTAGLDGVQLAVLALTVAALGIEAWLGWRAKRDYDGVLPVREEIAGATDEARRSFLGQATLLLVGLSVVAILFTAAPAAVFGTCA